LRSKTVAGCKMMSEQFKKLVALLEKIDGRLKVVDEKIERLAERLGSSGMAKPLTPRTMALDAETLLSLPDHLRETAISICKFGEATATKIAEDTGRARAAESDYLNQLVAMNYLGKKRVERQVVFYVKK